VRGHVKLHGRLARSGLVSAEPRWQRTAARGRSRPTRKVDLRCGDPRPTVRQGRAKTHSSRRSNVMVTETTP